MDAVSVPKHVERAREQLFSSAKTFLLEADTKALVFADYNHAIIQADAMVESDIELEIAQSPDPLPDILIKKMRRRGRMKERRAALKGVLKKHGLKKLPKADYRAIKATTGLGKTHGVIAALAELTTSGRRLHSVDLFEPTREKCFEVVADLRAAGVLAEVEYGYDADDHEWDKRDIDPAELSEGMTPGKVCVHTDAIKLAGSSGVFIREEFCKACPFIDRCGKKKNEAELDRIRQLGGVIVKTHARVDYPSVAGNAMLAIIDEDPSRRGHRIDDVKESEISQENLRGVLNLTDPKQIAMLDDFCQIIKDSLTSGFPVKDIQKSIRLMRRTEILLRKATDATRPKLDGDLTLANVQKQMRYFNVSYAKIAKLSELIRTAARFNLPLAFCNRIELKSGDGNDDVLYRYRHVKRPRFGKKTSCLFLSATMSLERMKTFIGRDDIECEILDVDRNIDISHVKTKSSTMALTGLAADGLPISARSVQRAVFRRDEIIRRITETTSEHDRILFVSNKSIEQVFLDDVPPNFEQAHFGELEGINKLSDCAAIGIVGQAWPAMIEVERQAAATALLNGDRITSMKSYLYKESQDGRQHECDMMGYLVTEQGPWHPCPYVRDEIFSKIEADYDQAIGRLRAVNSLVAKKVFIFRDFCPNGFEPTSVKNDLMSLPQQIEMFTARSAKRGWMPITTTAIQRLDADLFKDVQAVKNSMRRATDGRKSPIRDFINGLGSFPIRKESIKGEEPLQIWKFRFIGTKHFSRLLAHSDLEAADLRTDLTGVISLAPDPDYDLSKYREQTPAPPKPERKGLIPTEADNCTILSGFGDDPDRLMTKKFSMTRHGKIILSKTKHPYRFRGHETAFTTVEDMYHLLMRLSKDPYSYVVRGKPKPNLDMDAIYKRKWRGSEATFDNVPRSWFMADLDDFRLPLGIEFDPDDPGYAIKTVLNALPEPFKGVSCVVQLSASQGVTTSENQLKVHLWFKLSHALTQYQMRDLLRLVDEDKMFDEVTTRTVQPHFTSGPVCDGFDDPLIKRVYHYQVAGRQLVEIKQDLIDEISKPRAVSMSVHEDEIEQGISFHLFKQALEKIGGENGFHDPSGNALRFGAVSVHARHINREQCVSMVREHILSCDPAGRSTGDIEERASVESLGRWFDWWWENLYGKPPE